MSQWANEHPEEMAEITSLPLCAQPEALRSAIGYDPDRVRDEFDERGLCCECERWTLSSEDRGDCCHRIGQHPFILRGCARAFGLALPLLG